MNVPSVASSLASIAQATSRVGFEVQFNNLQNTLMKRFNNQVDVITSRNPSSVHKVVKLQKESSELVQSLPILEAYREANRNNYGQLEALQEELTDLRATISDDNNVTASEITNFTTKRDSVAQRLNNLYILVHPNFNDGQVILKLKESLAELESLTPIVGTLGGNNADISAFLTEIDNKVATSILTTSNTISSVLFMETNVQSRFTNLDTELLELTYEEQELRNSEIDSLKVDLGNTLRAISLSFEISGDLATAINNSLIKQKPPLGSVLNFFT